MLNLLYSIHAFLLTLDCCSASAFEISPFRLDTCRGFGCVSFYARRHGENWDILGIVSYFPMVSAIVGLIG